MQRCWRALSSQCGLGCKDLVAVTSPGMIRGWPATLWPGGGLCAAGWEVAAESAGPEAVAANTLSQGQPRAGRHQTLFRGLFMEAQRRMFWEIILDLDASDDQLPYVCHWGTPRPPLLAKALSILWREHPGTLYIVPEDAVRHGSDDARPAFGNGYEDPLGPFPGLE